MARRRNDDLLTTLMSLLVELPWWASVGFAAAAYAFLRFVFPAIVSNHPTWKSIAPLGPSLALVVAALFLLPAIVSGFSSFRKRKTLDGQIGIESIRALSWKQFEELLGEAYRRQGYAVRENTTPTPGPDGGIDLIIEKNGARHLVQCKQWRNVKVGVNVIREMYGIMTAEHADGVIIVTSGMFTQEAKNFAHDKPIDLVEGGQLAQMINNIQGRLAAATPTPPPCPLPVSSIPAFEHSSTSPTCPQCGGQLILRTAKRGPTPGSQFWGCSGYPKCKFTRPQEG